MKQKDTQCTFWVSSCFSAPALAMSFTGGPHSCPPREREQTMQAKDDALTHTHSEGPLKSPSPHPPIVRGEW